MPSTAASVPTAAPMRATGPLATVTAISATMPMVTPITAMTTVVMTAAPSATYINAAVCRRVAVITWRSVAWIVRLAITVTRRDNAAAQRSQTKCKCN